MKKILLLTFTLSIFSAFISAQINKDTPNLSFEKGSFLNWERYTSYFYYDPIPDSFNFGPWTPFSGASPRFLIGSNTNDPIVYCDLKNSPSNINAIRIGEPRQNELSGITKPGAASEKLIYRFIVTENTTLLSYKLAAVLKAPNDDLHNGDQRPNFQMDVQIKDIKGDTYFLPCSSYSTKADFANPQLLRNKTKTQCPSSVVTKPDDYVYQPWISGNIDLSEHLGDSVIITVINHDCLYDYGVPAGIKGGTHESYGYFWAETKKIELTSFSCEDSNAEIYAPVGFSAYNWRRSDNLPFTVDPVNPNHITIDKLYNVPGTVYYCDLVDAQSMCGTITVLSTINPIKINTDFTTQAVAAGQIQFTSNSTVEGDSITGYLWNFGDGSPMVTTKNPIHEYLTFDPIIVSLTVNSSKGCSKIISKTVIPTKELIADIFPPVNLQYNGQTKDFTATTNIDGLQMNFDYFILYTNLPGTPFYKSYTAPSNVGSYNAIFELSPLLKPRYEIKIIPSKDFTVTKAQLIVTANNVSKTYGDKITLSREAFTQDMKPLYAGDKIYELELTCSGLNDTTSVGIYSIVPTKAIGLGIDNYNIQFVAGFLTVNQKILNINAIDNAKTYGDEISATGKEFLIAPGSLVGNDTVTSVSLQCIGFDKLASVGTYPIVSSGAIGFRLSNYTINYKPAALLVNKKKIIVSAKQLTKIYGTSYAFSGKEFDTDLTQFVGSDSISAVQLISSATPQKAQVGDYSLSVTGINGYRLDNYDIKFENSTFKVNPMPVTISAISKNKEYGDLQAFSGSEFTIDKPLIIGDTILFVSLKSSGYIETAPIGKYDIVAAMAYGAGTLNYVFSYNPGTLNVVKKKLVATIFPPSYLGYNGRNKDFTTNVNVSGLLQNADYYILYTNKPGTQSYNSITAPIAAGDYNATFELSSSSLLKYYLDSIPNQDFTITRAPLTITSNDAIKTYGDKLNLLKDAFKTDIKPLFGSDKIYELELSSAGAIDTASIGSYSIIPTNAIGIGLENYDLHFADGKLNVYPKSLIIKAKDTSKTYGDSQLLNGNEFFVDAQYLIGNDSVCTVNSQCAGYTKNAIVGNYPIKISNATGNRLKNYLITYIDGSLQVTKKKITIATTTISKLYGNEYVFTGNEYSTDSTQFIGNDSISSVQFNSLGALKHSPVDDYNISISGISGQGLDNYEIKQLNNVLRVTPVSITVIAKNITKLYGELLTLNGNEFSTDKPFSNGDSISYVILKSSGCTETAQVGDYDIFALQAYGVGTLNYDFTYQPGKLSVIRKPISAKIFPPSYLVYNAQNKDFKATLSIVGLVQNTDYYIRYTNKTGTGFYNSFIAPATVGDYTATFELSSLSMLKFSLDTIPCQDFRITKAPLTITADNTTKFYGEKLNLQNDAFKMDMKALFGSDIIFEIVFDCKGLADTASVQKYPITPVKATGAGVENYDIHFVDGTLTVNPKQLTVKAADGTKIYGDISFPNPKGFYVDVHDLVGNDMVTSVTLISEGYNSASVTGPYPIKPSNAVGIRLKNYQISYADGNLQVLKKRITVQAKSIFKVYGNEYVFRGDEFETNASQFVGSDKITGIKLNSLGAQAKAAVGEYTLSVTDVTGNGIENYDITYQNGILFITPKPIVVIGKDIEKEFGDVFTFSGNEFTTDIPMLNNDTISFAFLKSVGAMESAPIGLYDIIPIQASGSGSLNYNISYRPGKLKVVQKQMLVTAQNCVKEYGENDPEIKFSVIDKRGIEFQPTMFSGKIAREQGEKVGEYTINKGTLSVSPSYDFTFTDGKLSIKKAYPIIDPYFTNNMGQLISADVFGNRNGEYPQGNLNVKIKQTNIDNTIALTNGTGKYLVSGLPNHVVEAEFNYLGDDNYFPATKTINIYAIIYHTNGGILSAPITHFDGNESVKLEIPNQKNNSKFEGWYENEDFSGVEIRRIPTATYHDVHLYAKWQVTYDDLSIVPLFNQVLAVANPLNRDFIYNSTYKWYKDDVLLGVGAKQYYGFNDEDYIPSGKYKVEIYYMSNAPIILELNHSAIVPRSKIYPNPLTRESQLTLCTALAKEDGISIEVYNTTGLRLNSIAVERDSDTFKLNGFNFAGIYIIKLVQNGIIKESHKVIVED